MSRKSEQIKKLSDEGAKRLLARVSDTYAVNHQSLRDRIAAAVSKYFLRDDENVSPDAMADFVDKLQAEDLCLIMACEQGNQRAWDDLVARFSATVRSAARSVSADEEGAEDLAQSIWGELHGLRRRDDGRPAGKLAYYSGRGSLAGWLRAVVAQLAVDQHRKQSRFVQTEEDSDFDRIIRDGQEENRWSIHAGGINPEVATSLKQANAEMQSALTRSIEQLSGEDRLLVKLYYFDGLRLREAGAVLGVHEATASRRLTRIHGDLRQQVESILKNERGWTKYEIDRAFAEVAPAMDTDIEGLLATEGNLAKGENEIAGG